MRVLALLITSLLASCSNTKMPFINGSTNQCNTLEGQRFSKRQQNTIIKQFEWCTKNRRNKVCFISDEYRSFWIIEGICLYENHSDPIWFLVQNNGGAPLTLPVSSKYFKQNDAENILKSSIWESVNFIRSREDSLDFIKFINKECSFYQKGRN